MRVLLARGLGPVLASRLRAHFGSLEHVAAAPACALERVEGIGRRRASSIRAAIDAADPNAEREAMIEHDARLILVGDADYPPLLATIRDPPTALWIAGNTEAIAHPGVAIVGARRCTSYGREQAGRFASLLAQSGLSIVSGGAIGIDAAAHRGAIRVGGTTIVVLGCGLAVGYPRRHADLFGQVIESGGVVISEHPMHMPPRAEHFPSRNRVISGLSLGVLVIEAAVRSGALITARLAAEEHHREVMAVPGRVDSPASLGCIRAMKEGWAAPVADHADVLAQLDGAAHLIRGAHEQVGGVRDASTRTCSLLTADQQRVLDELGKSDAPVPVDHLAARSNIPMSQLLGDLTLLEMQRRVTRTRDGVRVRQGRTF